MKHVIIIRLEQKHLLSLTSQLNFTEPFYSASPFCSNTHTQPHLPQTPGLPCSKKSISTAADLGLITAFTVDLCQGRVIPGRKNWYSSGYPARHPALQDQHWDWLAWHQYTVTEWDKKFDLKLMPQCCTTYNCLSRSVPEIYSACYWDVKKPASKHQFPPPSSSPHPQQITLTTNLRTESTITRKENASSVMT